MSSARQPPHRRRSLSASSPIRGPFRPDDPKWRFAAKRPRPSHPHSPPCRDIPGSDDPPEKWDVDQWRRGKRARRDSTSRAGTAQQRRPRPSSSLFPDEHIPSLPPMTVFPSTSAAFNLFPEHNHRRSRPISHPDPAYIHDDELLPSAQLDRMRSDAFGELQRCVAENGEGLVQRMRAWENSCSTSSASSPRLLTHDLQPARLRPSRHAGGGAEAGTAANDDDDVEIVSGDSSGLPSFHFRSPSHKKRALSLGMMDVDLPQIAVHPSPVDPSAALSAYSDDDDDFSILGSSSSSPPTLAHTYPNSSNSSAISLPLSHSSTSPYMLSRSFTFTSEHRVHVPSTASRSEKALAALTLAMANGAGGVNDYAALQFAQGQNSVIDECQVGELWH
ncbi:uncharacterized protein FIBRA_02955 [Fibroporia radiculosa]|uniref:Uncharacterized protein n=1 Tax=Fibroporia radiculosa TaxID=599839 RepID=J4H250_9APHY|nr:uncharacterized protein FIBRA_02955 [Fibroporia radiculosa]CCM00909.1 predicted protein [Fibroporia radiculosa]